MMSREKITVVVIAKNEEKNIADCLESVKWADEVIVVDDFSTDQTREIARRYTDNIINRKMDIEGRHRNFAYSKASNEWVLSLDADERVTPELADEISQTLVKPEYDGYTVPRRNYIGKVWLRHGGWYPAAHLKLFRKSKLKYEETEVHPRVIMNSPCGHLTKDIIHYSFQDIAGYIAKQNGQTTLEAIKIYKSEKGMSLGRALRRIIDRFFRAYIGKGGYRDGFYGFVAAVFGSWYQYTSYIKYREMLLKK